MASESLLVIFMLSCVAFIQVTGQVTCQPGIVDNLTLTLDGWLRWEPPREGCAPSHYYIYISHESGQREYVYAAGEPSLYIFHFLDICENYYFNIVAISWAGTLGLPNEIFARMPFPLDADLTVGLFSVASHETGVHLQWQVQEEWVKCAELYRITVYDEASDSPLDLYVNSNSVTLNNLIPCTPYLFGVRAIYNLGTEGPYTSARYTSAAVRTSAPVIQSVTLGRTTVNLSLQLENYSRNKCAVSAIIVDALPYFRITYPVLDQSNRPPLSVRLPDLEPDTMYVLNVTIVNSAGISEPTIIAVQTLE